VGTWEIFEHEGVERLYLVGLAAHKSYEEDPELSDVFPGHEKVFAHWFMVSCAALKGAQLKYRHMGYEAFMNTIS
jgi:hypothetical protein